MVQTFWAALIASSLAAAMTTAGVYAVRRVEGWARRHLAAFSGFAAGVLIGAALLHIIPHSMEMTGIAPVAFLAGYLFFYVLDTAFAGERAKAEGRKDNGRALGFVIVPLLGVGLHSFVDGVLYSITFSVSALTGILTAVGTVLHEFPEGIIAYVLLIRGGVRPERAFWIALVAVGLTTPAGLLISYPFISAVPETTLGMLLAVSGGGLLYVGATHLLPSLRGTTFGPFGLVSGIALSAVLVLLHD